jgi:hypothetical protein
VTERHIRGPYLTNVRFLLRYQSYCLIDDPARNGERQAILRVALYKLKKSTPRELLIEVTSDKTLQGELIPWIWNLINLRRIGVDLNEKLTMASPIWTLDTETTIKDVQ